MRNILEIMNYAFAGIFTVEFIIKYIGFGSRYFKDGWNTFDLIIVILTLFGIVIDKSSTL
jgi:TM2 domain-containing membrane protein YozV